MEEDGPLVPGILEGLLQLLDVGHHPEATLGVGVIEARVIGRDWCGGRHLGASACRDLQKGFGSLLGQVFGELE